MPAHPAGPGRGAVPTGQRLGRYRLAQRIGEGGMGVVHLGVDEQGTAVAVKVLRPHIAGDPEARRRLGREVDSLRRVRHPRVAAVLDADVDGDVPYVVTQFVPGLALDDHVREHGTLHGTALARLGNGLGEALAAIHAAGVVHRDLKPGNVLMLDGDPVVIDFGIAHVADDVRLTSTGLIMGTPGYLSPELVEGERVTQATDWWGWAATMTFAATGRSPFGRGPMEVVLDRVRRGAADLDGVPVVLVPVLAAALSVDPANRPAPGSLRVAVAELEAAALREAEAVREAEALREAEAVREAEAPREVEARGVDSEAGADGAEAEVMPFLRPAGGAAAAAAAAASPAGAAVAHSTGDPASAAAARGAGAPSRSSDDATQVVAVHPPAEVGEPATQVVAATTRVPAPALPPADADRTRPVPVEPAGEWTTVLPAAGAPPAAAGPAAAGLPAAAGSRAATAAAPSGATTALSLPTSQQTRVLPAVRPPAAPGAAAAAPAAPQVAARAVPSRTDGGPTQPGAAEVVRENPFRHPAPSSSHRSAAGPQNGYRPPDAYRPDARPLAAAAGGPGPAGAPAPTRPRQGQQASYRPLPTPVDGQRAVHQPVPVGPPAAPAPAGRSTPAPVAAAPVRPPRTAVLVAWVVALAALAGVLPMYALGAGLVSVVLARTVDRTLGALHRRRYERGARRSDGARAVASVPWHALAAVLVSVPAVVLPLLVGASVAFIVGLASPNGPAPGESIPLFAGVLAAGVTAWGGPGGGSVRRGSKAVARAVVPGPTASNVVAGLLVIVAVGGLVVAADRGWQPDWTPLQEAPFSADTAG